LLVFFFFSFSLIELYHLFLPLNTVTFSFRDVRVSSRGLYGDGYCSKTDKMGKLNDSTVGMRTKVTGVGWRWGSKSQ